MHALDGVDVDAPDGALTAIVGPSGSGKTTLLRCIAGLEPADAGRVLFGDRDVTSTAPGARGVAMAFQDLALYPHLDVEANIGFGLRAAGVAEAERRRRVHAIAESLSLTAVLGRRPRALSGGEAQRVALARAVVRDPQLLLLDEPFGALDAELRADARAAVRAIQRRLSVTTVLVTHDAAEAFALADHLVVLRDGRVVQAGDPLALHDRPATPMVARLLGAHPPAVLPASLALGRVGTGLCRLRPESVALTAPGKGRIDGVVSSVERTGSGLLICAVVGGAHDVRALLAREAGTVAPSLGSTVGLAWDDRDAWTFPDADAGTDDAH